MNDTHLTFMLISRMDLSLMTLLVFVSTVNLLFKDAR